jgi:hypothetical protein
VSDDDNQDDALPNDYAIKRDEDVALAREKFKELRQKVSREIGAVLILNLIPYLGLGFLFASGRGGVVFMLLIWLYEFVFRNQEIRVPIYVFLSIFGIAVVLVKNATEIERAAQMSRATTNPGYDSTSGVHRPSTSIEGLLHDEAGFALSSFDDKVKRAENQLVQNRIEKANNEDLSDDDLQIVNDSVDRYIKNDEARHRTPDEHVSLMQQMEQNRKRANDHHLSDDQLKVERQMLADNISRANSGQPVQDAQRGERAEIANQINPSGISADEISARQQLADHINKTGKLYEIKDGTTSGAAEIASLLAPAAPDPATVSPSEQSRAQATEIEITTPSAPEQVDMTAPQITVLAPESIATSSMLDARFAASTAKVVNDLDAVAFKEVRSDSISEATRLADLATSSFSAESAAASAKSLDAKEAQDTGKLIDANAGAPSVPSVESTAAAPEVGLSDHHLHSLGSVPQLGLGSVPGFENSNLSFNFGTTTGLAPSAPALDNDAAAVPATAGSGQKPAVCPKCGADLNGQFSFCLSCLAVL